jgi:tyrosyl-tRNA synthetase
MSAPEKLDFEEEQAYSGPKIQLNAEQEAQYERITRNLQEVTSAEVLRKVIAEGRTPRAYWGV